MSVSSLNQPLDFDTVYRLLQEREKDLEVAARIGQTLLRRNEVLEAGLGATLDSKQQCEQEVRVDWSVVLRYSLCRKNALEMLFKSELKHKLES